MLAVQGDEARFHKPVVYQLDGDRKVSVSNGFGFVSRLSADGTNLLFSTPFGDSIGYSDILYGVAVDGSGNIYFAGQTNGNSLPVTAGAFQSTN